MLTLAEMRRMTGIVMPVWYSKDTPESQMEDVLAPCLVDVGAFARPECVVVVIDGAPWVVPVVQRLQKRLGGFEFIAKDRNEGKGGSILCGIQRLLANASVEFIVARDHDNDHLINDALSVVNLAARMRAALGHDRVVGIGRRVSVHRHLGFVRGEFEWLTNEVCYEATKFALAREGKTVNTQFFAAYENVPDMQTGFKCYTRATAKLLVDALQDAGQLTPGIDVLRNGAEVPVIVETLLRGGVIGEITRSAWENQPLTTFDLAGRVHVKGTVLTWALRRTDVPLNVARQLLLNAIARRVIAKEERGFADVLALCNWALEKLSAFRGQRIEPIRSVDLAEYF